MALTISRLVAAMRRTSTRNSSLPPTRVKVPSSRKRSSLACSGLAHVGDFIQENGAAVGVLDPAGFLPDGAGEGAFFMAKQFAFQEGFGDGGAVDADVIVRARRRLREWMAPATSSLPVPLSPSMSTRGVGDGDRLDQLPQVAHLGRVADDLIEAEDFAGAGAQGGVFAEQADAVRRSARRRERVPRGRRAWPGSPWRRP